MNMNRNPDVRQLRAMIAGSDDNTGRHILWVANDGEVNLTLLPQGRTPAEWAEKMKDQFRFREETFQQGDGYVGVKASQDDKYMQEMVEDLMRDWVSKKRGYSDY